MESTWGKPGNSNSNNELSSIPRNHEDLPVRAWGYEAERTKLEEKKIMKQELIRIRNSVVEDDIHNENQRIITGTTKAPQTNYIGEPTRQHAEINQPQSYGPNQKKHPLLPSAPPGGNPVFHPINSQHFNVATPSNPGNFQNVQQPYPKLVVSSSIRQPQPLTFEESYTQPLDPSNKNQQNEFQNLDNRYRETQTRYEESEVRGRQPNKGFQNEDNQDNLGYSINERGIRDESSSGFSNNTNSGSRSKSGDRLRNLLSESANHSTTRLNRNTTTRKEDSGIDIKSSDQKELPLDSNQIPIPPPRVRSKSRPRGARDRQSTVTVDSRKDITEPNYFDHNQDENSRTSAGSSQNQNSLESNRSAKRRSKTVSRHIEIDGNRIEFPAAYQFPTDFDQLNDFGAPEASNSWGSKEDDDLGWGQKTKQLPDATGTAQQQYIQPPEEHLWTIKKTPTQPMTIGQQYIKPPEQQMLTIKKTPASSQPKVIQQQIIQPPEEYLWTIKKTPGPTNAGVIQQQYIQTPEKQMFTIKKSPNLEVGHQQYVNHTGQPIEEPKFTQTPRIQPEYYPQLTPRTHFKSPAMGPETVNSPGMPRSVAPQTNYAQMKEHDGPNSNIPNQASTRKTAMGQTTPKLGASEIREGGFMSPVNLNSTYSNGNGPEYDKRNHQPQNHNESDLWTQPHTESNTYQRNQYRHELQKEIPMNTFQRKQIQFSSTVQGINPTGVESHWDVNKSFEGQKSSPNRNSSSGFAKDREEEGCKCTLM
ncbi:hypothetical protein HK096_002765 [Nowakowskiella sp. JEL0078]|nr:hypothetical protein HK096_002765 [Nowakowskiella sp. JEL0078]